MEEKSVNTQQNTPRVSENQKKNNASIIGAAISVAAIVFIIITVLSSLGITGGGKAKDAAEKYVSRDVYVSLGVVPEVTKSEVIYHDGTKRLIEVKYALMSGSGWDGTYCVYVDGEYVRNSTTMMGAGYSFKEHLTEVKALFGI